MTTNARTYIEIYSAATAEDSDPDPIFEGEAAADDVTHVIADALGLIPALHGSVTLTVFEDRFIIRRVSDSRELGVAYLTAI